MVQNKSTILVALFLKYIGKGWWNRNIVSRFCILLGQNNGTSVAIVIFTARSHNKQAARCCVLLP